MDIGVKLLGIVLVVYVVVIGGLITLMIVGKPQGDDRSIDCMTIKEFKQLIKETNGRN